MDEQIVTFDEKQQIGVLSGKPPTAWQGPLRRAPAYYIGTTWGRRGEILRPGTESNADGSVPGLRNKAARRLIRKAFGNKFSRPEQGLRRTRALKAQAREVVEDAHYEKSRSARSRRARRLLKLELAIHQTVYCPSKKEIRRMRTEKRKLARAGMKDFITGAIEQLAEKR